MRAPSTGLAVSNAQTGGRAGGCHQAGEPWFLRLVGKKADDLQADHLCDLKLGVWVVSVQVQLHILEFCLFIMQSLFIAAGGRHWTDPGNRSC